MIPLSTLLSWIILLPHIGIAFTPKRYNELRINGATRQQDFVNLLHKDRKRYSAFSAKYDDDDNDDDTNEPTSFDEFLDKAFFDPDAYDDSDKTLLGRLAAFVRQDYELAETLYVGFLFVFLVIISQELLRMQLNGDHYVPFLKRSSTGRLF